MTTAILADDLLPGLVDERTGIIRRLERPDLPGDFPTAFRLVTAALSDSTVFSPWPSDPATAGCAFDDIGAARDAAVGEAVERYCGNVVRSGLRRASYAELEASGQAAVDPAVLALYSAEQHAEVGFPYVSFDRDLAVRWTPGRTLGSGAQVWVPASLVWVTYTETGALPSEPRTNGTVFAGIAAGPNREAAEWSALLEVVERDALVLAWCGGRSLIPATLPAGLPALLRSTPRLDLRCFEVASEIGLPVRLVLARDRERGYLTLGSACRPDAAAAATKAALEALQLQLLARQLDDPASAYNTATARREGPLHPWRADRRYTQSYRADLRDAVDPLCNLQLYLDPAMTERFEDALATRTRPAARSPEAPGPPPACLEEAVGCLGEQGHEVHSVEVTTSDLAGAGLSIVRVVVPGYTSNGPPSYPFAGGVRLARLAGPGRPDLAVPLPH